MSKAKKKVRTQSLKAMPANSEIATDETASLMYGELNLRKIPGSKPSKYGVNLAKELFTQTELLTQMCDPGVLMSTGVLVRGIGHLLTSQKPHLSRKLFWIKHNCWPEAKEAISRLGREAKSQKRARASSKI